ncbi:pentapeptide repeat-containing protein [Maridesulfovibrio frigidus]|uniref:pentapeptide repeat-containing protein n=1 Tax=Maridesulfovibrio frigidus TaxID=340956 RepID=UPI0006913194|nr:pentapeptide repeat-containing protein [Maridesulfovibrio frigidus]
MSDESLKDISFYNCQFIKSSFQFANLVSCVFENCTFSNCNLALAKLKNTNFIDAEFIDSKLLGVNWSSVRVVIVASFVNCLLDSSSFSDMNLAKMKFVSCSMIEAAFTNTKLTRVKFDDCDLARCLFSGADLSFADFSTSRNYYMDAESNKLHKTIFSLPEAVSLLGNLDIELK